MTTLHVTFVWHMHQPLYLDPVSGQYVMPWVGYHAVKGYYDMPLILEECEGARAVFNMTPVLLRQLEDYAAGGVHDAFRELSAKPAAELSQADRTYMLAHFFMCNWHSMVLPYKGYNRLLEMRGQDIHLHDLEQTCKQFSDQDFLDLQVWYNLTWFGNKALERIPELNQLKEKSHDFTEHDKAFVLEAADRIIREVLDIYRRLYDSGRIELTTTPFYHPILPLVYNTDLARRCMPGVNLPLRFSAAEDARAQVEKAAAYHEKIFGRRPSGMWPSEGSVAPELIPIVQHAGIKWMATDEDILLRSVPPKDKGDLLYKPYRALREGAEVAMVFRDRGLSDRIGFDYARLPAGQAVDDFCRNLGSIRDYLAGRGVDNGLVSVILDGENPWEGFPDSGQEFLKELYSRIVKTDGLELTTVSDYIAEHPPQDVIDHLFTGSWIEHNFRIWIGHPEDNRAWEALSQTRQDLVQNSQNASGPEVDQAWEELYAAEGSDWFWWYGDDFSSDMDAVFDQTFRMHLKNTYKLLGIEPRLDLETPLRFEHKAAVTEAPKDFISPMIDGRVSDYYEWEAAGHLNLKRTQGAMYRSESFLEHIYFGFDMDNFYLRLDPASTQNNHNDISQAIQFRVHFLKPKDMQIRFTWDRLNDSIQNAKLVLSEGEGEAGTEHLTSVAADKIIELAVSFEQLNLSARDEPAFRVEVLIDDVEVEKHPGDNYISFLVPDASFKRRMWSV